MIIGKNSKKEALRKKKIPAKIQSTEALAYAYIYLLR